MDSLSSSSFAPHATDLPKFSKELPLLPMTHNLISPNLSDNPFENIDQRLKDTGKALEALQRSYNHSGGMDDYFSRKGLRLSQEWNNLSMLRHIAQLYERVGKLAEVMASKTGLSLPP